MNNWYTHNSNFKQLNDRLLPSLDRGVSALFDDLEARGLLDETLGVKPFMDAHTYDQDRIDKCCVHIIARDGTPLFVQ